jgi:hypothetical protein
MNRLKLIILSSALSLITIGVFAGRAKFVPQNVYTNVGGTEYKITGSALVDELQTNQPPGASQAEIKGSFGSNTYPVYAKDGMSIVPLYTQSF